MQKMIFIVILGIFLACTGTDKSHTETAQIVVESFCQKDFPTLEKYTTKESFSSFMSINDIVPVAELRQVNIREAILKQNIIQIRRKWRNTIS